LDSGADIAALDQLDLKLWVALSCPTRGLEFDTRTLDLIDEDHDGRIRAAEIIAATQWACRCLKSPDDLIKGSPTLPLEAINDATPEGRQLLASARQILANLGKSPAGGIAVEDTLDPTRIFAQSKFNGDGIVPAEAADDPALQTVIADIIACVGPVPDRSGKPGVDRAKVDAFFAEAQAYSDWRKAAETDVSLLPFGDRTEAAVALVKSLRTKVDDYFARCRLAAFDPRAQAALNREEKEYLAFAAKDLTLTAAEIAGLPLARIEAGRPLPLLDGVNPAWSDMTARLRSEVVKPLLGEKDSLTGGDWTRIADACRPYETWAAAKAGAAVERLGLPRVREILAGKAKASLDDLIARDKALEAEANAIAAVERLARYHRDLYKLLLNFVNFRDFYGRKEKAIFQAGRLFLDQRSCDLCLAVEDSAKHAGMAALAGTYLVYCDCSRRCGGDKMQIVAALTDGDADNLLVGRNGLFIDRKGRDWDATITKIVENPISIRQAFWTPYKKVIRMIEQQVAKRASASDAAASTKLESAATAVVHADKAKPPEKKKLDVGTVAALGVGLGAIATVVGGFISGFLKLVWWQMPLALLGLMVVISTPAAIIAALKLHKRNLGPILDANGWAINAKALINIPFGRSLTGMPVLPPGSHRDLTDPYAEKKSGRTVALIAVSSAVLIWAVWRLWRCGAIEAIAPGALPRP
jgi:hypothetical protein